MEYLEMISESKEEAEVLKRRIMNWEMVRGNIYPILLWERENQELLQKLESRRMLDLRVCYIIREKEDAWEHGRIKITKELVKAWGITEEVLFCQAVENLRNDNYKITELGEMLLELAGIPDEESYMLEKPDEECRVRENAEGLYVFSNKERMYGAAGILIGTLYFGRVFGKRDLYIIPSSVHEVLLLPYSNQWTVKQLNSMVREVNQEQVLPEERLADHIYFYDAGRGAIKAL